MSTKFMNIALIYHLKRLSDRYECQWVPMGMDNMIPISGQWDKYDTHT